jgi:Icc protein
MSRRIVYDHNHDGIDRRGFLECMAWVGTGVLYTMTGGVLESETVNGASLKHARTGDFSFAQISDSHIGFKRDPNSDVTATLREAVARINALPRRPDFLIHTGDITHLSAAGEFDTASQVLTAAKTGRVFYVPGEHDVLTDDGKSYLDRYGKGSSGHGWYSFDHKGVHFIGLVNVLNLRPGGMGLLGNDQLEWLEKDVSRLSDSTPIVVFAHMPLWSIYPKWGWGTDDAAQALTYLKRFGSVTVLNGHIHQTMQKVEGNVTFHTATSTAFPQPQPGTAPGPGPLKVPADKLRGLLGLTDVNFTRTRGSLAIIDSTLADA